MSKRLVNIQGAWYVDVWETGCTECVCSTTAKAIHILKANVLARMSTNNSKWDTMINENIPFILYVIMGLDLWSKGYSKLIKKEIYF